MKKIITLLILNAAFLISFAQAPQGFNYQAVARNLSGTALINQAVGLKISLHQGTAGGTIVYTETHATTSNNLGLLNMVIGSGTPVTGTFNSINWAGGPYFIEISMDVTGGTSYVVMGTQQLMSVPYALYAQNSGSAGTQGVTGATGTNGAMGATGNNGSTGTTGSNGAAGITGTTGAVGATGLTGNTGSIGTTGSTGAAGLITAGAAIGNTIYWDGTQWVANSSNIYNAGGNIGINTSTPNVAALLHVELGSSTTNGVLVTGTYNASSTVPDFGAGSRMMFYPGKGSFRAGFVNGTQWDNANTGYFSTSMGYNSTANASNSTALGNGTTASGPSSTAMGIFTIASGSYSTAMGSNTNASASFSTAMGNSTIASGGTSTALGNSATASGHISTAMGDYTIASGDVSIAMGFTTNAPSFAETVIGQYNTVYTPLSTNSWNAADRLFVIGNGTSSGAASNAMTVLKNGNTGFGTSTPSQILDVTGNIKFSGALMPNNAAGINGYVLTSGGAGAPPVWTNPSGLMRWDLIASPTSNLTLAHGANTTSFSFDGLTAGNAFSLTSASTAGAGFTPSTIFNVSSSGANSNSFHTTWGVYCSIANTGSASFNYAGYFKASGGANGNYALVTDGGLVGFGTTSPSKALVEVNGSQSNTLTYGYLSPTGTTGATSGTANYSIYASQRIAALEFNAYSDARIKKVIDVSNNAKDLNTLMNIRIKDYQFIDTIGKGNKVYKKLIAQELETVYPNAVSRIKDEVPDIFKTAEIKNGKITIANNLKAGEKVKLIFDKRTELAEVIEADANSFKVNLADEGPVFVYGRQVTDFRVVDYEALSTLSISAMQAQQKMIENLKTENANFKAELEHSKKENSDFKNKFIKIENELDEIQKRNVSAEKEK